MLRDRLIAAALGLPMLCVLLWLNWYTRVHAAPWGLQDNLPLLGIVLLIAGASGWEVARIVHQRYPGVTLLNGIYAAIILPLLFHAVRVATPDTIPVSVSLLFDSVVVTAAVMLLFLGIWTDVEQHGRPALTGNLIVLLAGVYLGLTLSTLLFLGNSPLHEMAVAMIFMLVFALDTAAYFGGRRFGGLPLAPLVSPKKTLSGAFCGLLGAVTVALLFKIVPAPMGMAHTAPAWWNLGGYLNWPQVLALGIGVGIIGQIGDLLESAFKRWGAVKDSGVIPGHGGFLDRFDSLLLAAPLGYVLLTHFLHLPW